MDIEEHKCPICEKFVDRKQPNDYIQSFVCRSFGNPEMVNDYIIFDTQYLIEKWKTGKSRHPDLKFNEKLKLEEITDEMMEHVKQSLISFVSETDSIKLFRDTIDLLSSFNDPSLLPLLQGWLNQYFRSYLLHGSTMNTIIKCIESTGEKVHDENSDKIDWSNNADAARCYLIEKLHIVA
jgi:hypothetical protein